MSKFIVLAAVLALSVVACNKKEEAAAPAEGTTVEQTAPVETAPTTEAAPEAAPATEAAPTEAPAEQH
ncbi:MAG: hypothetical protein V4598_02035 [Bdellovibrionota bacterium]